MASRPLSWLGDATAPAPEPGTTSKAAAPRPPTRASAGPALVDPSPTVLAESSGLSPTSPADPPQPEPHEEASWTAAEWAAWSAWPGASWQGSGSWWQGRRWQGRHGHAPASAAGSVQLLASAPASSSSDRPVVALVGDTTKERRAARAKARTEARQAKATVPLFMAAPSAITPPMICNRVAVPWGTTVTSDHCKCEEFARFLGTHGTNPHFVRGITEAHDREGRPFKLGDPLSYFRPGGSHMRERRWYSAVACIDLALGLPVFRPPASTWDSDNRAAGGDFAAMQTRKASAPSSNNVADWGRACRIECAGSEG